MLRMLRWLVIAMLLVIAAGIGAALAFRWGAGQGLLRRALTPIEDDAGSRALLVASGAGRVDEVRALLHEGVKAEPEMLAAAASGPFEPVFSQNGCERHAEVIRLLVTARPDLTLGHDARGRAMRTLSWLRGCTAQYRQALR